VKAEAKETNKDDKQIDPKAALKASRDSHS